jgi:hypothetical protein
MKVGYLLTMGQLGQGQMTLDYRRELWSLVMGIHSSFELVPRQNINGRDGCKMVQRCEFGVLHEENLSPEALGRRISGINFRVVAGLPTHGLTLETTGQ